MSRSMYRPDRTAPPGPHPDWSTAEWFVYDAPFVIEGTSVVATSYRVAVRKLSPGEMRKAERLVATVKRCSLATVRHLLRAGTTPTEIQARADADADAQAKRTIEPGNAYRELVARRAEEARRMRDRPREQQAA